MFYLQVEDDFSSAHQLRGYRGKCENLHGHNWRVRVRVCGERLGGIGMLMDFGDLKKLVKSLMDRLDHKFLNEIPPFDAVNPTSENLAQYLFEELDALLPGEVRTYEVTVWESDKCAATYRAE